VHSGISEAVSFADLERTLTEGGRWNELLQLYESRLEREADGPQASLILARAAGLLLEKLRDPNRAEGLLRRLLDRDPENTVGREGLQQIYEDRGDHEALCDLLEREAARAPSPAEAAATYVELGRLLDEKLGRKARALVMWQRALRLVPDHAEALDLAQRCSVELGRLDAARSLLDRELAARPDGAKEVARRYAQLGSVALEQASRHEFAERCATAALAADPDCEAAKVVLSSVAALREDWKGEVRALRARAMEERDRKVASRHYLQAAALHAAFDASSEGEARSRECLERSFLLWPGNPEALDFLERRHAASGDWDGLAKAFEALVGVTPESAGKAELFLRLSTLWSVRFDDKARSVAALEQAAALDPGRDEAVVPLLEHLEDGRQPDRAIELLERYLSAGGASPRATDLRLKLAELYLAEGAKDRARAHLEAVLRKDPRQERAEALLEPLLDEEEHAGALAKMLERRSDRLADPRERRDLLLRASRLSHAAPKERMRLLGRALVATPGDPQVHDELEEVGREAQASEGVAQLYQAALLSVDDPQTRLSLLVRLGRVFEEDLGRAAEAAACARQAAALSPDDPSIAADLERRMEKAGEHAALAASQREKLARTEDPGQRRALLEKLAAHHERQGDDPEALVEIYRELLALHTDPQMQRKLAATLGGLSRFTEQREVLEALAARDGPDGLGARMELAQLLATRLGAPEDAADLHLAILAEAPDSHATVSALEALLQAGVAVERIGAALGPHFEARGEWSRLAAVLEARISVERDPDVRRLRFLALADVHAEKLGDPRGAFDALSRTFAEAPEAGELLASLEKRAEELGAHLELARILRGGWRTGDAEEDRALASSAALLAARAPSDPDLVAAAHHRLLEIDPTDASALSALEAIAARDERWPEATGFVERLLAVDPAPAARAEREMRLAGYLRRQGQHADAARSLRSALGAGADEEAVLPLLADSLEQAGLVAELAEVLSRMLERATLAGDTEGAARLALQRARTLEGLGSKAAAVADYAALLAERPFDPDAIQALEALLSDPEARASAARALERSYVASASWRKLHGVIEIQVEDSTDPVFRARELRRLAQLSARELQSPALAFGALARAFQEAPDDPLLRSELRVAAADADCLEELAELMAEVADAKADSIAVPQLLALEREIAELYEKKLGDPEAAIARYERMRRLDPSSLDALRGLHRLHREGSDWRGLHGVALALAGAVQDLRERLSLWREAARIAAEQICDPALAAQTWRRIADADATDAEALVQLDGLYLSLDRGADLAWVLEKRRALAIHAGEGLAVTELSFRLASLRRTACADPRGALDLYREVLVAEPDHAEARAELEAWARKDEPGAAQALDLVDKVLGASGRHERRLELREARLGLPIPAEERVARYEELRGICELDLQRADMAFAVCAKAFAERVVKDPADLERLARKSGRFAELAELYEATLRRDPEASGALRRRAAEIREVELHDVEGALRLWREIAAADPDDDDALAALERLCRASGRHDEVAVLLERKIEASASDEERLERLVELARLRFSSLGDAGGAIEASRRALEIDERHGPALDLLGEIYAAGHRFEDLAALYERRSALASGEESLLWMAEQASLLAHRLGDPAGAVAIHGRILEAAPRHEASLRALEALARDPDPHLRARAAERLEPVFAAELDHRRRVEMLEAMAEVEEDPSRRAERYAAISRIYAEELEAPELAFAAAGRALRADPDDPARLAPCADAARVADMEEELAALLEECAAAARTLEGKAFLGRNLATLLEARGETAGARAAWKRVHGLLPDDMEALRSLARLEEEAGDPHARIEVLRALLAREEEPAACAARLLEIAQVQEDLLDDPLAALSSLRRVVEIEPGHAVALDAMDRLCLLTQRFEDLDDVLRRKLELPTEDVALARQTRVRLAEVRVRHLGDERGALDLLAQVLSEDPRHAPARQLLESIVAASPEDADAAAILEGACRASGDWQRCAELVEGRIARLPDPEARKEALLDLARLREEHQRRPDLAFLALGRAFREEPGDDAIWPLAAAAAKAADSVEEWIAIAEGAMLEVREAKVASALALHLAALCEEDAGDDEAAIGWLERAERLDPAAAPVVLPALDRLYPRAQRWEDHARVLERRIAAEPEGRIENLARLGQLARERLGDADRAILAWESVLESDPEHGTALRALDGLYSETGRHEELLRILVAQRRAADAADPRLSLRIGELAAEVGQDDLAIAHLREVLDAEPRNEHARDRLEALYEAAGRWEDLAALLRGRIAQSLDPRELGRLHEKLGGILRDRLDDPAGAVASFRAVLDRDPRSVAALGALRELYAQSGDLEALAGVLRRLIPLQDGAAGVKAVRLELAGAFVALGRTDEAKDSLKRVLDLEPHQAAELQRAEALLRALEAWPEVVRALEMRASLASGDEAIELWSEIARTFAQAGRPEAGAPALEKILEAHPDDAGAFETLRGIYRDAADWRRYATATERFAARLEDPAAQIPLLRELARVHEERLGQKELAFAKLSAAFEMAPTDPELRADLERLAAACDMREELAMIYETVAEGLEGKAGAASLWLARGRLLGESLDDADEAEASFRRILESDPHDAEALDALESLLERRGAHRKLAEVLERKLDAAQPEQKRELLLKLATLHDEALGDPGEAIYSLRRAFELDPADASVLESLCALYRREERFADLASLLARSRDLASTDADRISLQLRLGAVQENDLADAQGAIASFAAVLDLDPANSEAMEALERIYTRDDRYAELLRIYDRKLQITESPREKARLYAKAAGIWEERLQNPANAVACLEGVLSLEPDNLRALRELGRLLRDLSSWERLAQVYRQHEALAAADPALAQERLELRVKLAELLRDELHDSAQAERAFAAALELDERCRPAIRGLATIYERSGNWAQALAMLERQVRLADDVQEAIELHHRIGSIHADVLGDVEAARASFERALELDEAYLPAIRALRELHHKRGDTEAWLQALEQEAAHAADPAEKTRLWVELGRHHLDVRGDGEAALRAFEEARRHGPDALAVAMPLSDLYVERERWADAEAVLDVVCARLTEKGNEPELLTHKVYRLGFVAARLGNREKARRSYERAYELDPTFLPAAEGLGGELARAGDHAAALKVYQAILIHHRDELTEPEVVEIYFTIGDLRRKLGEAAAARRSLESALELDPWHLESHRALVALAEEAGDHELAIAHKQKLAEVAEGEEKAEILRSIASAASEKLGDHYLAIDSLVAALRLRPDDVPLMEELLALYRETKQGPKAVELLEQLVAMPAVQEDPERAIRFHFLLGACFAEEARSDDEQRARAASHFNAVLDLDWRQTPAFQALEALLVEARDWRGLEANYVTMLERLGKVEGTGKARAVLFRTLGDLYLETLADTKAAIEAYKAVTILAPDDGAAAERYANLVSQQRGSEPEAIEAWRRALPHQASHVAGARTLMRLHARRKAYDEAFACAQVIAYLWGEGGTDEEEILERLRPFGKDSASAVLSDRSWRELVYHERLRGTIGGILAVVQAESGGVFARDHASLSIQGRDVRIDRKRDRVDVATSMLFFGNAYRYVATTLGMEAIELYKVPGISGLHLADTWPTCLVAGEELFTDQRPKKELYFQIGRALAWARPELSMARLRRRDQLELIVESAAKLGDSKLETRFDERTVERVRRQLAKSISPAGQQRLKALAKAYAAERPDVGAYLEAADRTATRVGGLLAGDLRVAARLLGEGGADAEVEATRRIDLSLFCLSDAWTRLRKELGVQVAVPT